MLTVWKYAFKLNDEVRIEMPMGARLLDVQVQRDDICLWALVDSDLPRTIRRFVIHGTGHPIARKSEELGYVGTFQLAGGSLVFHLFEIVEGGLTS